MGYRVTRKKYKLVFPEDEPLYGVEIFVGGLTLGEFNDLRSKTDAETNVFDKKTIETGAFLGYVTEWNLEDESGQPYPVGQEGFNSLSPADSTAILRRWIGVALGSDVPVPLDGPSKDGDSTANTPNMLGSLPMESM